MPVQVPSWEEFEALVARVSALETVKPPEGDGWEAIWPVTALPQGVQLWQFNGDVNELRRRVSEGGVWVGLPDGGEIVLDKPLEVSGSDVILAGIGAGTVVRGGGIYVTGPRVIVDNVEVQSPGTGEYDDGFRANEKGATDVIFSRVTCDDAGDECLDVWNAGRVTVVDAKLGMGTPRYAQQEHPFAMIIGGENAQQTQVGLYESVFGGGFRNPFMNGPAYLYMALCELPRWDIQGVGLINGAKALVERNWFGYAGYHGARAHEPNNTGADDNTVSLRTFGNHHEVSPRTEQWHPERVPEPGQYYKPRALPQAGISAGRGSSRD